ncbi:hypothetical protein FRACA_1410003 [Frankia canadensis]|uniref:Uncharacterized protein n=1 Tax=Frankia canadensis TaxID=1836972 RepID=A0A2I2KLG2_9ACTN|nr:hypothetical protein FRACA_1410003 [Frankia canadensis]SOU53774.1 hypothetical protein FRACA_1410003 [Frankia canadensis]
MIAVLPSCVADGPAGRRSFLTLTVDIERVNSSAHRPETSPQRSVADRSKCEIGRSPWTLYCYYGGRRTFSCPKGRQAI